MKILFLSLFFSLQSFGQAIQTKTVKLPSDLAGVKLDAPNDEYVSIKVSYIMFNKFIEIKESNNLSIESFFQNLMWIYKNKDQKKLVEQFDDTAQKKLLELKNFDSQFEVMSLIRKPFLKSVQVFQDGFLYRWTDESFLDERKIFVKKIKNKFKISALSISKDDYYFWNSNLFFKYQRFEKKKPVTLTKFSSIKDAQVKDLSVSMDDGFMHLNIFKASDSFVNLVALDNYDSAKYPFKDFEPKLGQMRLQFSGKNFKKKGKHELHLIQSTYPLGTLNAGHLKQSITIELIKN
jgi:hypothetical protein